MKDAESIRTKREKVYSKPIIGCQGKEWGRRDDGMVKFIALARPAFPDLSYYAGYP
jgi:hypothetical protein